MITRLASLSGRMAVAFVMLFTIGACGGGGGGGGGGDFYNGDEDGQSAYSLELKLYGPDGEPTNEITSTSPGTLRVKVKSGSSVSNMVVTTTTTIGTVFPESGTALTNSDGIATFQIEVDAGKGAGTITSTVSPEEGSFSGTLDFQVGDSGLRLGYFDADGDFIENQIKIEPQTPLASQGRAQLSVDILDADGNRASTAENVRFSSGCLSTGQATLDPVSPILSANGKVTATYNAAGCAGTDEITASLVGAVSQAFGSISIASAQATGLSFVSAEPDLIVLRGTGGGASRSESSDVVFQVLGSNGDPVAGIEVDFSLTTFVGGLSLSPTSALSASDGTVKTTVFSGDVATVVRVVASAPADDGTGDRVSTVSDILTVSTGLPDQNSISLSVAGGFVVENGFRTDGLTRTLTVAMSDRFNNPVIDGTAAVFTTEFGTIQSSCTTVGGTCSVQWRSQAPRYPTLEENREAVKTINGPGYNCPSHNGNRGACPDDLGYTRGGRSTVLVTAIGEESFVDTNGNGVMDQEERDLFDNVPEAFVDYNEDGAYTPALSKCKSSPGTAQCKAGSEEEFRDFNSNERYDLNDNPAVYNGLNCPPEGDGNWCSRELVNVRDDAVLILSADPEWDILLARGGAVVPGTVERLRYTAYIADLYNSRPPAGSTITVKAGGGCEVISEQTFEVANSSAKGAVAITVETGGDGQAGTVSITLKPTGGADYTETFECLSEPDPEPEPEPEPV